MFEKLVFTYGSIDYVPFSKGMSYERVLTIILTCFATSSRTRSISRDFRHVHFFHNAHTFYRLTKSHLLTSHSVRYQWDKFLNLTLSELHCSRCPYFIGVPKVIQVSTNDKDWVLVKISYFRNKFLKNKRHWKKIFQRKDFIICHKKMHPLFLWRIHSCSIERSISNYQKWFQEKCSCTCQLRLSLIFSEAREQREQNIVD